MKCPIACKYCMADLVPSRSLQWDQQGSESIGLNKSACFLNRRGGRPLKEWAPIHLLHGETVGFQGIQDPLDPRWTEDLLWLLNQAPTFGGITLVTKWPRIQEDVLQHIASTPNCVLIVSLTGADSLEPGSTTVQRIAVAGRVRKAGGRVHALVHPWIAGVSNIDWLPRAKDAGITEYTVKGFRYTKAMGPLGIPPKYLQQYLEKEGQEVLVDPPLEMSVPLPRFQGSETREDAVQAVHELEKMVVFSSSSSKEDVLATAVERRIKNFCL